MKERRGKCGWRKREPMAVYSERKESIGVGEFMNGVSGSKGKDSLRTRRTGWTWEGREISEGRMEKRNCVGGGRKYGTQYWRRDTV